MKYNRKTHLLISYLYQLRALSYNQINQHIFSSFEFSESYKEKILKILVRDDYIEKHGFYKDESYYCVSKLGIQYLRTFGVIDFASGSVTYPNIATKSILKLRKSLIYHQLALNDFILTFKKEHPDLNFEYYDELFIPNKSSIMNPDGILKFNGRIFFLEMDMKTERSTALRSKWEHYLNYLISDDGCKIEEPIEVLFILENISSFDNIRKYNSMHFFCEFLYNMVSPLFSATFDNPRGILDYISNKYIIKVNESINLLKQKGFLVTRKSYKDVSLLENEFDHYIFIPNESKDKIKMESGIPLDFLYDEFQNSAYIYKKMRSFPGIASVYHAKKQRTLKYLVLVDSIDQALSITKDIHVYGLFYTTKERLKMDSIYESFFTIDKDLNVYHFENGNFQKLISEQ